MPRWVELRDDLHLLHAVRIALIQRIFVISTHMPEFSPQHETTPEELHAQILHLDIDGAVARLAAIFPKTDPTELPADFGEPRPIAATPISPTRPSTRRSSSRWSACSR